MTALVWFRNDLRIADNPALMAALSEHRRVYFLLTLHPGQWRAHGWSAIKWDFYQRQAQSLAAELAGYKQQLQILVAPYFTDLPPLLSGYCRQRGVKTVYANHDYPLDERKRDSAAAGLLAESGVALKLYYSNLLVAPEQISPTGGVFYKVFTPFYRQWKKRLPLSLSDTLSPSSIKKLLAGLRPVPFADSEEASVYPATHLAAIESLKVFTDSLPGLADSSDWPAGEAAAQRLLLDFLAERLKDYHHARDFPAQEAGSRLSPYWEAGVLSPLSAARALAEQFPSFPFALSEGGESWLSELAWREFYQHLVWHHDRISMGYAFKPESERYPWRGECEDFKRWCDGETGFPLVDAGMRQLKESGWMHNRLRMIVAGFLCKDLHIDWRLGESYFMSRLIDGSFAANNGGWQWSASTGTDSVPYFRVFNPITQSRRYDKHGDYIRTWVKELAEVPDKYIHEPHDWLASREGQIKSAKAYPPPIVDHKQAREMFIYNYKHYSANRGR